MINTKMGAFLLAAFMAGAFLASPDLRAYAANTVFSTDIKDGEVKTPDLANNAVTSTKIKDGEVKTDDIAPSAIGSLRIKDNDVKAQDIAPDAVGASELQGVSKLIFAECSVSFTGLVAPGGNVYLNCSVPGTDSDDSAVVTQRGYSTCFAVSDVLNSPDRLLVSLTNACTFNNAPGTGRLSAIVYDS